MTNMLSNIAKLTSSIGLVYHGLDNSSPCIDEPLGNETKEKN